VLFHQPDLEAVLRAAVAGTAAVSLRTGADVTGLVVDGDRVDVAVRQGGRAHSVQASFVLGCDGANSTVRGLVGAGMRDLGRPDRWLVVDARRPAAPSGWPGVHQVSNPRRAATFMPLPGDRFRWEFRLRPGETAAELAGPDRLAGLLAPFGAWSVQPDRVVEYVYRAQVADRWRSGRVLLAGDAAHLSPPFIGQGLGLGLRDAHQLAWKLADVVAGRAPEQLLDTYQAEREPHARALIRTALLLGALMTRGGRAGTVARRGVLAVVRRFPLVATLATASRTPALRPGPLVERRGRPGRRLAGTLVPQPEVLVDGRTFRLDEVLGPGSAELRLDGDRLLVRREGETEQEITEPGGTLARWLRSAGATAVRIRPDRIVQSAT
jgi:3-(3-hydroxy-phenyl)propionate hydroxylase